MKTTTFEKPQFIEALTFKVAPEDVDKYLKVEEEVWFKDMVDLPGFLGSETWVSETKPGEITQIYFWESEEAFNSISQEFKDEHVKCTDEACKNEFVSAWHVLDKRYRIREFR